MRLTKEERVKIVELHFKNNSSVVSVQRNSRKIFDNETSPSKKCIKGTSVEIQRNRDDRKRTSMWQSAKLSN